jgi:hypothetical protein
VLCYGNKKNLDNQRGLQGMKMTGKGSKEKENCFYALQTSLFYFYFFLLQLYFFLQFTFTVHIR